MSYEFKGRPIHDIGNYVVSRHHHWLTEGGCASFFDIPRSMVSEICQRHEVSRSTRANVTVIDRFQVELALAQYDLVGLRHMANRLGLTPDSCVNLADEITKRSMGLLTFRIVSKKHIFIGRAFEQAVHATIVKRPKVWSSLTSRTRDALAFLQHNGRHAEPAHDIYENTEFANDTCAITQLSISAKHAEVLNNGKPTPLRPDMVSWAVLVSDSEDLNKLVEPMLYPEARRRILGANAP